MKALTQPTQALKYSLLFALTTFLLLSAIPEAPNGNYSAGNTAAVAAGELNDNSSGKKLAGTLEGHYKVDQHGAATYSISLDVPPGRNGIQPHLSIVYNSNHDNGFLGQGFMLGGLSAITRVGATEELDGFRGTVNMDTNDRFSLDGKRLIAVKDANGKKLNTTAAQKDAYGKKGTYYFTHHQSWSQVSANFTDEAKGPAEFVVTTKDGLTMKYKGYSPGKDGINLSWHLESVRDANNNFYEISYRNRSAKAGDHYPKKISYTAGSSLSAKNSVIFKYENRTGPGGSDYSAHYVAGHRISSSKRLSAIKTYASSQLVHTYTFDYTNDNPTGRSLLTSITKSDAQGNYLPPTKFSWESQGKSGDDAFSMTSASIKPPSVMYWFQAEDSEDYQEWEVVKFRTTEGILRDLNGDGWADFTKAMGLGETGKKTFIDKKIYFGGPSGFSKQSYTLPGYINWIYIPHNDDGDPYKIWETTQGQLIDINGDGLEDYTEATDRFKNNSIENTNKHIWFNTGQGFKKANFDLPFSIFLVHLADKDDPEEHPLYSLTAGQLIDMNGDGLPDFTQGVYNHVNGKTDWEVYLNEKGGKFVHRNGFPLPGPLFGIYKNKDENYYSITAGMLQDINGDGLADYIDSTQYHLARSDGSYQPGQNLPSKIFRYHKNDDGEIHSRPLAQFIDINGDRLSDFIVGYGGGKSDQTADVYLNTGKKFVRSNNLPGALFISSSDNNGGFITWQDGKLQDFNGDGLPDYFALPKGPVYLNNGSRFIKSKTFQPLQRKYKYSDQPLGQLTDINGDGFADMVRAYRESKPGDDPDYYDNVQTPTQEVYFGKSYRNVVTVIADGVGKQQRISYKPLTDKSVYQKYPSGLKKNEEYNTYPYKYIQGSRYVVAYDTVRWDNQANNFHSKSYGYIGAKVKQTGKGRGALGFQSIIETDDQTGHFTTTYFSQSYPTAGHVESRGSTTSGWGTLTLSETQYTYQVDTTSYHNVIAIYKQHERTDHYSTDGSTNSAKAFTSAREYQYDLYGNITMIADTGDVSINTETVYTHFNYTNSTTPWRLGLLTDRKTTKGTSAQFNSWDLQNDLSWEQTTYYPHRFNIKSRKRWNDEHQNWVGSSFKYDRFGNLTHTTDPLGQTSRVVYDRIYHTFITQKIAPPATAGGDSLRTHFKYDPKTGALLEKTDANGITLGYNIDGFGRTTTLWGPDIKDPKKRVQLASYNLTTSPGGYGTIFIKKQPVWEDLQGYEQGIWRTSGNKLTPPYWSTEWEHRDALGRVYLQRSSIPDGFSINKQKLYDSAGRLWKESLPYFSYSNTDDIHWTEFSYNNAGKIDTIRVNKDHADEKITAMTYYAGKKYLDRTVAYGTKHAASTRLTLNSHGKLVERVDPDTGKTTYHYDLLGRPHTIIDPKIVKNTTTYSSLGLKKSVQNNDMGLTKFSYDRTGLLHQKIDANNNVTTYTYDQLGRLSHKKIFRPQGLSDRANQRDIHYYYDQQNLPGAFNKGRLTGIKVTDNFGKENTCSYQYAYDAYGQLIYSMMTVPEGSFVESHTYAPTGELLRQTLPDRTVIQPAYDTAGRLLKLSGGLNYRGPETPPEAGVTFLRYTAMDQPDSVEYLNGVTATYDYSNEGLLQHHRIYTESNTYLKHSYQWTPVYDIHQITDHQNANYNQVFTYDPVSRLKKATGIYGSKSYHYDRSGNITEKDGKMYTYLKGKQASHRAQTFGDMTFTYDNAGNMIGKDFDASTQNWTYNYDGENRLSQLYKSNPSTGKNILTNQYTYDHAGRLIREKQGTDSISLHISDQFKVSIKGTQKNYTSYLSGPDGHEASLTRAGSASLVPSPFTSTLEGIGPFYYQFPGYGLFSKLLIVLNDAALARISLQWLLLGISLLAILLGFYSVLRYRRARNSDRYHRPAWVISFTPPVLAATIFLSIIGTTPSVLAEPVLPPDNATVYYLHHDHIHSISLMTDASGNVAYKAHYMPFGELYSAPENSDHFEPEFAGKPYNPSSKLYHYGARFYDPHLARFITADTQVGNDPFSPQAFNRYAYSGNNPVDDFDPSGHILVSLLVGFFIGAIVSAASYGIQQAINHKRFDWGDFGAAFFIGALSGLAGGIVGLGTTALLGNAFQVLIKSATEVALRTANIAIGMVAGAAGAAATQASSNALTMLYTGKSLTAGEWFKSMTLAIVIGGAFGALTGIIKGTNLSVVNPGESKTMVEEEEPINVETKRRFGSYRGLKIAGDETRETGRWILEVKSISGKQWAIGNPWEILKSVGTSAALLTKILNAASQDLSKDLPKDLHKNKHKDTNAVANAVSTQGSKPKYKTHDMH